MSVKKKQTIIEFDQVILTKKVGDFDVDSLGKVVRVYPGKKAFEVEFKVGKKTTKVDVPITSLMKFTKYVECIGVDDLIHICEPHKDKTICGIKVKRKKMLRDDFVVRYSCGGCD